MSRHLKFLVNTLWLAVLLFGLPRPSLSADRPLFSSVAQEYQDSVDIEIIKAIARHLDRRLQISYAPFKRRLKLMQTGSIDLMVGLLRKPDREQFIYFIDPPYKDRSDTVFFVKRGHAPLIEAYEDLYALRIGTILGSTYFPRFDNDARLKKEAVSNSLSNFNKLMAGRIDTAVFPESAGIELIHRMGIRDRVALADFRFAGQKYVYIGVSRKSRLMAEIQSVEAAVRTMNDGGEFNRIIVEHYSRKGMAVPSF